MAQWLKRLSSNHMVPGSSPCWGDKQCDGGISFQAMRVRKRVSYCTSFPTKVMVVRKKLFSSNKSKLEYFSLLFFPKLQRRLHLKMFFELFVRRCGLAVKAPV